MRGDRRQRSTLIAAIAASLLALAGCGGGDKEPSASSPTGTGTATGTGPTATKPSGTGTGTATEPLKRNPRRAAIERTVAFFFASVERSDAATACRLLGHPPTSLEGCARAAGIDLTRVPSSDEESVQRVRMAGRRASVRLSSGQTVTLRRARGGWVITGLRP
ncbi:MAG: hypothetical protein ABR581_04150 [Thermoleophilaceae bacterium]